MRELRASSNLDRLNAKQLTDFKKELAPIFDPRFFTLGHGTRPETATTILKQGLEMKSANPASTSVPLESTDAGLRKILNWRHHNLQAIVVIMIPRDPKIAIVQPEQIMEEITGTDELYGNKWRLPSRFIRGYVDVTTRKFIANPSFEENPDIPPPRPRQERALHVEKGSADIPAPVDDTNSDMDVF